MAVKSSMVTEDTDSDYLKKKKNQLPHLHGYFIQGHNIDRQVMKIHSGCFLKYLLQGYGMEAFPILKAADNKD